jgi:hypothetical protein
MNLSSKAPALIVAAGISLTAMGASSQHATLSETRVAQIHQSLSEAKLVEAPYRAAHLVMAAPKAERSSVTRTVVEEVLALHPTAVSATVRAILTVAPDEVVAVMEGVMEKTPKAYAPALAAIMEMNPGLMASAGSIVLVKLPGESSIVNTFVTEASQVSGVDATYAAGRLPLRKVNSSGSSLVAQKNANVPKQNSCLNAP